MTDVDLRIDAQWIVPVEPAGTLTGHALIVDGGRIVALLPASQADARYAARETNLHVVAETIAWLDKYVKKAAPKNTTAAR